MNNFCYDENSKNKEVLIIGNDINLMQELCKTLVNQDLIVSGACSSNTAAWLIAEFLPSFIFFDCKWSKIEALKTISKIHTLHPDVMIILMSGQNDLIDISHFKQFDSVTVLKKPLQNENINSFIYKQAGS